MIATVFIVLATLGLAPLVENVPGVKQVQAFTRKVVTVVRNFFADQTL